MHPKVVSNVSFFRDTWAGIQHISHNTKISIVFDLSVQFLYITVFECSFKKNLKIVLISNELFAFL